MRLEKIEVSKIKVGDRVRKDLGDIEGLARSIEDIGLLNPITVWRGGDGTYNLVAGERRLEACKRLGWEEIEAIVLEAGESEP
ncbi:hypothetical protein AKJ65_01540 [candidate division MSBL1 archaeon SCGC-AAA259E19]|uniref:ParB-like N-terminal domain-containing protein n=1 Tax=candidate division MSBL1 archaeon SCGC-AAA259E19 TaxID=1698264 RepID=A0A133UMT0_9EURY|nr:hypothetical protein AKJ65_01540 [candidate division MSBL1 archaeon SCGC-AAA259E19]